MKKRFSAAIAGLGMCVAALAGAASLPANAPARHVLLISVDGLHGSDLAYFIEAHPHSTLAALARHGIDYGNARTVGPADSFPGLLALITGGTPAATGVYYDVTYDRSLSPAGSDCRGRGAAVPYNEAIDATAAGKRDTIDPAKLPRDPRDGCRPVYPHAYLRVNTVFEAVRAAGGYTAWTDKHPAYELVQGPSGHGVDDLFLPEIGANYEARQAAPVNGITASLARTEAYDDMKAHALVNEIDGLTHDGRRRAPVPNLFGLNLQAINVAQKLYGYRDADGAPTPGLTQALEHTDRILGRFVEALRRQGLRDDTLIVVTAKHGNGPIDPARLHKVDRNALARVIDAAAPGALAQLTVDSGALIWLRAPSATAQVAAALRAHAAPLGIADVLSGERLARRFPSPQQDSRTPDIIVMAKAGVIYTKPADGKRMEHGGFGNDDRHVALLLSSPRLAHAGRLVTYPVSTTQVAPTMLAALGLHPTALKAVVLENTPTLPQVDWLKPR